MSGLSRIIKRVFGGGHSPVSITPSTGSPPQPRAQGGGGATSTSQRATSPEAAGPEGHWWIGTKYEVYRELGRGGMGVVYLAYDHDEKVLAALKTFHDRYLADEQARKSFRKEAQVWVSLDDHPFIVPAWRVIEHSGRLYVETGYVAPDYRGRNCLSHYLVGKPVEPSQALCWAIQICHAMEHAYAKGVTAHRDLKPQNVMIMLDGTAKVTDFGLAKVALEASSTARPGLTACPTVGRYGLSLVPTRAGAWLGTPGYMAPEQWEDASRVDQRGDVYSLGVVLYQMASGGRLPFEVAGYKDLGDYCRQMQALQVRSTPCRLDCMYWPAIKRCLTRRPGDRYGSFAEICQDLESLLQGRFGQRVEVPAQQQRTATAWSNKGSSLNSLGRYDEAITCLDKALAIDPRFAAAWINKGNSLNSLGRYEEAIACLDKALAIDSRFAAAWINKGNSLNSLGRYEEAIACLDKALAIDPRDEVAWINKGNSLDNLGRYDEAIACLDKALAIDPRLTVAWINKGGSLDNLGRYEESIACLDKALAIDPRDAAAWHNKGNSLYSLGRYEEAIACYDKTLVIDPRLAVAWNNKGNSLNSLGRYDEAITCLDKALAIDPRDTAAWYNKAFACEEIGRRREAAESYRRFLALAPPQDADAIKNVRAAIQRLEEG